jgi:hypothetical protein
MYTLGQTPFDEGRETLEDIQAELEEMEGEIGEVLEDMEYNGGPVAQNGTDIAPAPPKPDIKKEMPWMLIGGVAIGLFLLGSLTK